MFGFRNVAKGSGQLDHLDANENGIEEAEAWSEDDSPTKPKKRFKVSPWQILVRNSIFIIPSKHETFI